MTNVKPVFNVSKCTDLHSQLDCKLFLEMETSTSTPPPHTHPLGHKHDKCTEDQTDRQTSKLTPLGT